MTPPLTVPTGSLPFIRLITTGSEESIFTVVEVGTTPFILAQFFPNYCIIFHTDTRKPTSAPPCMDLAGPEA